MRNLRTRTFVTAGIATDAPKMPNRAAIPQRPEPASGRRAARCAAATPTACRSTRPRPTERELRGARAPTTTATFANFRVIQPRRRAQTPSRHPRPDGRLPGVGRATPRRCWPSAPTRSRARLDFIDGAEALADSHLRRTWALSQQLKRGARQPVRVRQVGRGLPRPRLHLHGVAAGLRRARSRASCSRPSRATASSTRARWRCCCGWPASRRAWRPASPRARSTARPRSTSCATSTRTPGSRRGSPTSAGSRSTRRRPPRPRARRATSAARRRSATPPTSAAAARSTRAPARPRPRARTGGRSSAAASRRWRCSSSAASPSAAAARRAAPLPELERALRRARRPPAPGATLQALEDSFARSPAAAAYVRALREQRYGGRGGEPTLAQRRGLRSELGRGGGPIGRLRAWWALPPRPSMPSARRRTIDAHG